MAVGEGMKGVKEELDELMSSPVTCNHEKMSGLLGAMKKLSDVGKVWPADGNIFFFQKYLLGLSPEDCPKPIMMDEVGDLSQ